jgi:cytochrome b subunit of formate dehydrogenase
MGRDRPETGMKGLVKITLSDIFVPDRNMITLRATVFVIDFNQVNYIYLLILHLYFTPLRGLKVYLHVNRG